MRKGGTLVEKIHRIQEAGLEVWSGQILGFDNDGPDIFDQQIAFIEQARIATSMVGMLSAIPKTPLHARLSRERRLDPSDRPETGTNVIPLRLRPEELRDGYVRVMQRVYAPEAYFRRVRRLYLEGPLSTHEHWPRRSWFAALRSTARIAAEAAFIAVRLQTRVEDRALRRIYRRIIGEALRRRSLRLLQILAMKCAMHYHAARLVGDMSNCAGPVNTI